MALEIETATYQAHLLELLNSEGKFVVIKDTGILGAYESYEEALAAGYEQFGPVPFLVKQIRRVEPVLQFSRDLPLCPP